MKKRPGVLELVGAVLTVCFAVGFLVHSDAVSEGVRKGLSVSAGVLVPSLFPFMVLSGFLSRTEYGRIISLPFGWITEKVFRLRREFGSVILLSLTGGYPVGAKTIAGLLEQGRISKKTAERMLCFCVNAGPPFLITAVGCGMFFDRTAGIILFAVQTATTLLIGAFVSLRARPEKESPQNIPYTANAAAFVQAVTGAASAVIAMCAFAVLFSGLLELVRRAGLISLLSDCIHADESTVNVVVCGFFEVTSGCMAASGLQGAAAFTLTSAFVSFGGLSVLFQIMACFRDTPIRFSPFIFSRLAHMALSSLMAWPLYRFCGGSGPVWAASDVPVPAGDQRSWLFFICLMAMCTILLLSGGGMKTRKKLLKVNRKDKQGNNCRFMS